MTDIKAAGSTGQINQVQSDPDQTSAEFPNCSACGSERIVRDAWAYWDTQAQDWQLDAVFDYSFCLSCEEEAGMEWRSSPLTRTERIRRLNDAVRTGRRKDGTIASRSPGSWPGLYCRSPEDCLCVQRLQRRQPPPRTTSVRSP